MESERELRLEPDRLVNSGCRVTRHLGNRVVELHRAIDTRDIKGVIDVHWEELRMLTTGDEGFDKVGRSPPFYRGSLCPLAILSTPMHIPK